jgi:cytosine/uracil/thiamine/allantoin permease
MSSPPSAPQPSPRAVRRWPAWGTKVISMVAATFVIGWGFSWAQTRLYQADRTAGFWTGLVHGAVMPAALPCLLVGKDVPIFASNNTGRLYKLGYVFGINCSGIVFFGLGFRPTTTKTAEANRSGIAT